ncbi:MAG TPA: NUDIX hydrolase [Patescibacteria group bacterium]|nr:NUDIX hydrolase [Patescibacteria group bacterium]
MGIEMLPISVKGVIFEDDNVWIRKNERQEWELPGGKIDKGEQPEAALKRELLEELGFLVDVLNITDATILTIPGSIDESSGVLVLVYSCSILKKSGKFEFMGESGPAEFKSTNISVIDSLHMENFYKNAINKSYSQKNKKQ